MDRRHPRNPPTRPLVLIVEGHEDSRAMYALALSAMGFDVIGVQDGDDACRRALEVHPDVIVADLPMPTDDGWQFIESLKHNPRTRDIPIFGMTGYLQRSVEERAEREGLAAFFPKPCLPDELAAGLRRLLDAHPASVSGNHKSAKQWAADTGESSHVERRRIPPCPQCDAANAERVLAVAPESRLRWFRCRECGRLWNVAPPVKT